MKNIPYIDRYSIILSSTANPLSGV